MRNILIFDLDGTLVDSNVLCVAILQEMLDERNSGVVIDPQHAVRYMSLGGAQMVSALLGPSCGDPEAELVEFRARYASRPTPADSLFAGVAEGLARLRAADFALAVCSNKPHHLCAKVLDEIGLAPLFDVTVGGQPHLRPKPAPDLLDAALAQLGAVAGQCLFIGDSELDHAIADAVGIPFLFMSYGYAKPGWHAPDCAAFDHFDAMVGEVLGGRWSRE